MMCKNGADLIMGSHPHVIEPVKWIEAENGNKALVYYSLGNYVSRQKETNNLLGIMGKVIISRDAKGKISIKEACKGDEYVKILKDVKLHPKQYLAQKRFESKPLKTEDGTEYHVCIGSYTVQGKHAGYYARMSIYPRIDSFAEDIPVLIENR
jgi:arginine decarboxylase-like protein